MRHLFKNMLPSSQYTSCSYVGSSDCTRHFSNPCDICMVAKIVQGHQSDNHCNQSDTWVSILLLGVELN